MPAFTVDRDEIVRLTEQYGGAWGINHTRRLLHLVSLVGEGEIYDAEAVWVAAHLHDWGAYAPWAQKGMDHAVRSTQVAEEFLTARGYPPDLKARVLACVAGHHRAPSDAPVEALLLRDADALDFLGVVGVLRDFSKNPRDLRAGFEATRKRRAELAGTFHFARARELAAGRIRQMDELLAAFEEQSFGCF